MTIAASLVAALRRPAAPRTLEELSEPPTSRGRATKTQIVAAAAELMHRQGIAVTTVDEVLAAAGAGKGQFYYYFDSKDDLVAAVLEHQLESVLAEQRAFEISTWAGLERWLQSLVAMQSERPLYGCPLGSLVAEVSDHERLRTVAAAAFARWESELAGALARMLENGLLREQSNPAALAEAVLATVQGGYLISGAKQRVEPLRNAVAAALQLIRGEAAEDSLY